MILSVVALIASVIAIAFLKSWEAGTYFLVWVLIFEMLRMKSDETL